MLTGVVQESHRPIRCGAALSNRRSRADDFARVTPHIRVMSADRPVAHPDQPGLGNLRFISGNEPLRVRPDDTHQGLIGAHRNAVLGCNRGQ
jgi:hypothetical protein